jgi:predicted transposase YbfD/YdcC
LRSHLPPYERRRRQREHEFAEDAGKEHGRREIRRIEVSEILRGYTDWPGLKRVCRIERTRVIRGHRAQEVVYAVTSLSREQADAAQLLCLSRAHWGIENRLHCVRDTTFDEDRCRVRSGSGPQVFAAIRNAVITMLRSLGFTNMMEAVESFQYDRAVAARLIRYGTIE